MNSIVRRFEVEEVNGKQYLVHHLDSVGEQSMDSPPLFACPLLRLISFKKRIVDSYGEEEWSNTDIKEIDFSPYLNDVIRKNESLDDNYKRERLDLDNRHYVLPLFWCKNKDDADDNDGSCYMCKQHLKIGTHYYFCVHCDDIYHKECVESPTEIKHPYHPNHPLKLSINDKEVECLNCQTKKGTRSVYYCSICTISMHNTCALKSISFVIEKTKRHDHTIIFFTRKDHLRCNVCGLINSNHSTYVCLKCDFVVHQDCADFPSIIRISRHHHRISFTSSLQPGKWICGVCRKNVDGDYGAYTCNKCDGYVVHSRCALRRDIWDGKELEGIPDDIEEVLDPFESLSDGLILHFLHDHHLKSETSGEVYDENKICDACVLPIYEGKYYSCIECDFILHDKCVNAPRKKRHPLHPHPLTLKITSDYRKEGYFRCNACNRDCSGFIYECNISESYFRLDIRCASIVEPFVYQGHKHPLFLALDPQEKHLCQVCQMDDGHLINCIECDFIICLECVNLPYMAKYKHDNHFLTLVHGEETKEPDWCQVCERLLISSGEKDKRFYECKQCCTTLHIKCLLGNKPYMKPGHIVHDCVQILPNDSLSRPSCLSCGDRCVDKVLFRLASKVFHILGFKRSNYIYCCLNHTPVY